MLRERRPKPKIVPPKLSSPINTEYQFIHMPMPSSKNKPRNNDEHVHRMIPIDHIISTSIESRSYNDKNDKIKIENKNKTGLKHYLHNTTTNKEKLFKTKKHKKHIVLNAFLSHNAKYQNLHIILISLLLFCVFLIVSLCSPDIIGLDDSFQEIYYPQTHTDNFIFVYGPLINKQFNLRKHIKYTPQRKNPYILHDHFDPDIEDKKYNEMDNENVYDSDEDDEGIIQAEFPVRIHHLKRGFYFDTCFNDMDNEQIIKYKQDKSINNEHVFKHKRINHSYTGLGVQFDQHYDVTVNGLLLRIDEESLLQFDVNWFGEAFKRETIPLQWIDFLYSKPKEFLKNMELEQETLNTIKKETIDMFDSIESENKNASMGVVDVKKEDIDDANSMIQQQVDIEIDTKTMNSESDDTNDSDLDLELLDLIDNDGVLLVNNNDINEENIIKKENELNIFNEENTKKYQLNVWTYIVPKEIMIDDRKGQFERIMKQSYIDIVLSGCLDIGGTQFAKEFVQSTFGWTPFMVWNDDRGHSKNFKYEESFITQYHHEKIDLLLQKYVFGHKNIAI